MQLKQSYHYSTLNVLLQQQACIEEKILVMAFCNQREKVAQRLNIWSEISLSQLHNVKKTIILQTQVSTWNIGKLFPFCVYSYIYWCLYFVRDMKYNSGWVHLFYQGPSHDWCQIGLLPFSVD